MALNCDALISQAIGTSCTPHPAGYEKRAIIINKADIDTITIVDNVISEIELKSGKSGYEIKQQGKAFMGTKVEGVVGDYGNTWNKTRRNSSCEVAQSGSVFRRIERRVPDDFREQGQRHRRGLRI